MLSRLALRDVRNHADRVIEAGRGLVVLTGANGTGKTNVLEAVSLLAPGRGLRGAALSAVARQDGPGGFAIAATLEAPGGSVELGTGAFASAPERRVTRINGAAAASTALAEWLSVLWLTPAMDRLFVEAASGRRRFLDRLVLALVPGHAARATRYEAAMRQRNRLLADERAPDPAWLAGLEAQMATDGAVIAADRATTVAALADRLAADAARDFPRAGLALEGEAPDAGTLAAALAASRARDAAAGRTLVGPHRQDLAVTHCDKAQPAALASTGEQKALLLGLVLAHAALVTERTGRAPVLLLDEVAAHLDPDRRAALFRRLAGLGQVWMTGTEPRLFDGVGEDAIRLTL